MPRVLVVDDDADVLDLAEEIFRSQGWQVTGAGSAHRARERLDRVKYDIAVINLTMPGEGGLSFADHAASRGLPVLLISGNSAGISDALPLPYPLLLKPFRVHDLIQAVDDVLTTVAERRQE